MFSDLIQAYNLIDVNNRTCHVQIIDNDTKELIYDSDSFEDTTDCYQQDGFQRVLWRYILWR